MSFERKSLFSDDIKDKKTDTPAPATARKAGKADDLDDLFGEGPDAAAAKKKAGGRLPLKTW